MPKNSPGAEDAPATTRKKIERTPEETTRIRIDRNNKNLDITSNTYQDGSRYRKKTKFYAAEQDPVTVSGGYHDDLEERFEMPSFVWHNEEKIFLDRKMMEELQPEKEKKTHSDRVKHPSNLFNKALRTTRWLNRKGRTQHDVGEFDVPRKFKKGLPNQITVKRVSKPKDSKSEEGSDEEEDDSEKSEDDGDDEDGDWRNEKEVDDGQEGVSSTKLPRERVAAVVKKGEGGEDYEGSVGRSKKGVPKVRKVRKVSAGAAKKKDSSSENSEEEVSSTRMPKEIVVAIVGPKRSYTTVLSKEQDSGKGLKINLASKSDVADSSNDIVQDDGLSMQKKSEVVDATDHPKEDSDSSYIGVNDVEIEDSEEESPEFNQQDESASGKDVIGRNPEKSSSDDKVASTTTKFFEGTESFTGKKQYVRDETFYSSNNRQIGYNLTTIDFAAIPEGADLSSRGTSTLHLNDAEAGNGILHDSPSGLGPVIYDIEVTDYWSSLIESSPVVVSNTKKKDLEKLQMALKTLGEGGSAAGLTGMGFASPTASGATSPSYTYSCSRAPSVVAEGSAYTPQRTPGGSLAGRPRMTDEQKKIAKAQRIVRRSFDPFLKKDMQPTRPLSARFAPRVAPYGKSSALPTTQQVQDLMEMRHYPALQSDKAERTLLAARERQRKIDKDTQDYEESQARLLEKKQMAAEARENKKKRKAEEKMKED